MMTYDLTTGSPWKKILNFAFPVFLVMLQQQLYNVTDMIIVGRCLGIQALAGVGSVACLIFLMTGLCTGLTSGFTISAARQYQAGNYRELRRYVNNSYYITAAAAVIMTLLALVLCRPVLQLMRTPEDLFPYACRYLIRIVLGIPAILPFLLAMGILQTLGDRRTPGIFLILATMVNILLDVFLILGMDMGVAGAAWATDMTQLLAGAVCLMYMKKNLTILKSLPQENKEEKLLRLSHMGRLLKNGIPLGLQFVLTGMGLIALQTAVNGLGSEYVAGMTIAIRIIGLACCPIEALGTTMAAYAGSNVAVWKLKRLEQGLQGAMAMAAIYCAAILGMLYLATPTLAQFFMNPSDQSTLDHVWLYVMGNTIFLILMSASGILRFMIQGMGFHSIASISALIEMLMRCLIAWMVFRNLDFSAACTCSPAAWMAACLYLVPQFFLCMRKLTQKRELEISNARLYNMELAEQS